MLIENMFRVDLELLKGQEIIMVIQHPLFSTGTALFLLPLQSCPLDDGTNMPIGEPKTIFAFHVPAQRCSAKVCLLSCFRKEAVFHGKRDFLKGMGDAGLVL